MEGFIYAQRPTQSITSFQAKAALIDVGLYEAALGLINHPDTAPRLKLAWEEGINFQIDNPMVIWVAEQLDITELLPELFAKAMMIQEGTL